MEPNSIKIKKDSIKSVLCYGLRSETEYKTRKQDENFSGIVYIQNLRHDPMDRNSNQFVALTSHEYEIVS